MEFLDEMFGSNIQKTMNPKRKFAAKEYFEEIDNYTKLLDLRNGKIIQLEEAVDKYGIIDVQLIDFTGSIFLDKAGTIKPGFNHLFQSNEVNKDTDLLHHKIHLVRFMRKFKHRAAMVEYEQIIKFGEMDEDKFTKFRYICLKGRILMRWRKLKEAKEEFEKAFSLIETKFTEEDRTRLINERLTRIKPVFIEPNWDTNIVDYDEIVLNMLFATINIWLNKPQDIENTVLLLNDTLVNAGSYEAIYDVILIHEQLSEIYKKQRKLDLSEYHISKAIELMNQHNFIKLDPFNYGLFHLSLFEVYLDNGKFQQLSSIVNQLEKKITLNTNNQINFAHYKLKVNMLFMENKSKKAFVFAKEYIDEAMGSFGMYRERSPLFIVKEIYQLILLGIELNLINEIGEISKYEEYLDSLIINFPVVLVYKQLINLQFRIQHSLINGIKELDISRIEKSFDQLLLRNQNDLPRYVNILILYYYFLSNLIKETSKHKNRLLGLSEKVSSILLSSPYSMIIMKNEVIKQITLGNRERLQLWLDEMNNTFQIYEIQRVIDLINSFNNDEFEICDLVIKLIYNDLFYSNFENRLEVPIQSILTGKN